MAERALAKADILLGRLQSFTINGNSAELLSLKNLPSGSVRVTEEIIKGEHENVDRTKIHEKQARKVNFEFTYDEVDTTDIAAISGGDEIVLETASGGTNGTGVVMTITDLDYVAAFIEELKTKVVGEVIALWEDGVPYTIVANAAA